MDGDGKDDQKTAVVDASGTPEMHQLHSPPTPSVEGSEKSMKFERPELSEEDICTRVYREAVQQKIANKIKYKEGDDGDTVHDGDEGGGGLTVNEGDRNTTSANDNTRGGGDSTYRVHF